MKTVGRNNKLRVGLLVDEYHVPAWVHQMITIIQTSSYAEIVLVVKNNSAVKTGWLSKIRKQYRHILYKSYRIVENLIFRPSPDAFEQKDIRPLFPADLGIIDVTPEKKKFTDQFREDDVNKIKKYQIDVFLRLGFRILKGEILSAARYGIWSFHHGDNLVNRGGPAGAWEVMGKEELTGSVLQILKENLDGGTVLYRSWASTYKYAINKNLNFYFWKSLSFIPRCLERLFLLGEQDFFKEIQEFNQHPDFYSHPLFIKPTNTEFFKFILIHALKISLEAIQRIFFKKQWMLYYHIDEQRPFSTSLYRYKKILPPKGSFWADPFVVANCSKFYIFFEEYVNKVKRGRISCIEMDKNGNYSEPRIILEKPYHLSYPFIFCWEDKYYMIPESRENKTVQLYESDSFPYNWKYVMNLMENVEAVDTTIYFKDNTFWLFTNICEHQGGSVSDELFLFSSNEFPSSKWKPHPQNPIISDVRTARPAGRLFQYNGNLYRPSQDGSRSYGFATNINHVIELNENRYKEVKVGAIQPKWDREILCTHSFSFEGSLTVVDALVRMNKIWKAV